MARQKRRRWQPKKLFDGKPLSKTARARWNKREREGKNLTPEELAKRRKEIHGRACQNHYRKALNKPLPADLTGGKLDGELQLFFNALPAVRNVADPDLPASKIRAIVFFATDNYNNFDRSWYRTQRRLRALNLLFHTGNAHHISQLDLQWMIAMEETRQTLEIFTEREKYVAKLISTIKEQKQVQDTKKAASALMAVFDQLKLDSGEEELGVQAGKGKAREVMADEEVDDSDDEYEDEDEEDDEEDDFDFDTPVATGSAVELPAFLSELSSQLAVCSLDQKRELVKAVEAGVDRERLMGLAKERGKASSSSAVPAREEPVDMMEE